jgi:hypothetical protein
MASNDIENFGTFEDWFLATMDRDSAETLRDYGAEAGVCGLTNYSDIWALYDRFGSEIEGLALEAWGAELWEVARDRSVESIDELITLVVHAAAESLAHSLANEFEDDEEEDELEEDEACL